MSQQPPSPTLIDLFTSRLSAVGGQVSQVADSAAVAERIAAIARESDTNTVWISADIHDRTSALTSALTAQGLQAKVPTDPVDARDQALGLAIAEATIAETGTSIMSEPRVESRAVTLTTETLVIVCPRAALLPSLDEAAGVLRGISANGASYATFITGPSRTADIERQLTVGVQGPGVFHVILVDELS